MSIQEKRERGDLKARKGRDETQLRKMQQSSIDSTGTMEDGRAALCDNLVSHVIKSIRGKSVYAASLVWGIARIGASPSGGSRSSISKVAAHTGGKFRD